MEPAAAVSPAARARGRGPPFGAAVCAPACGTGGSGGLDRALLHEQLGRHLGVGAAGRQEPQHLQLPLGQRLDHSVRCGPAPGHRRRRAGCHRPATRRPPAHARPAPPRPGRPERAGRLAFVDEGSDDALRLGQGDRRRQRPERRLPVALGRRAAPAGSAPEPQPAHSLPLGQPPGGLQVPFGCRSRAASPVARPWTTRTAPA